MLQCISYLPCLLTNEITDCLCNSGGSLKNDGSVCTSNDPCQCDLKGQCTCALGYKGQKCNKCEAGFFDLDGRDFDSLANCTSKSTKTYKHIFCTYFITFLSRLSM